mmetsp:Transcript_21448/g.47665  ORF Transcript_21448/g.47665 Transcript_21448/m.47665 type:complete len:214 (-) Transcript_21448:87-728(-)
MTSPLPSRCAALATVTMRVYAAPVPVPVLGGGACASRGHSRPVSAKWPRWLMPKCFSNPSFVTSLSGIAITPALLHRMSMRGTVCLSCSAQRSTDRRSPRSSCSQDTSPPLRCLISSTAASARAGVLHSRMVFAPREASFTAVSLPSPTFAPVITATFPANDTASSKLGPFTAFLPNAKPTRANPPMMGLKLGLAESAMLLGTGAFSAKALTV